MLGGKVHLLFIAFLDSLETFSYSICRLVHFTSQPFNRALTLLTTPVYFLTAAFDIKNFLYLSLYITLSENLEHKVFHKSMQK